jgi:hypothetical protein
MLRRRCEECGKRLASDTVACWNCGASLAPERKTEVDQAHLIVLLFLLLLQLGFCCCVFSIPVAGVAGDAGNGVVVLVLYGLGPLVLVILGVVVLIWSWLKKRRFSNRLEQADLQKLGDEDEDE